MKLTLLACLWAGVAVAVPVTQNGNMNGRYLVATGDKMGPQVPWNDDYASKGHEYFDVWAPEIATHYGEVFWTSQGNQPLPPKIVERFKGKVMAITGYEQDQVMVVPTGQPGVNPEQDVSVPINWAYNHHYMAWMTGAHSEMVQVEAHGNDHVDYSVLKNGKPLKWVARDKHNREVPRNFAGVAPTSQMFSEGNGGESRKSFHGYPDGFAQLIESPETWTITPMQIDTRNRDCGATYKDVHNCSKMTPGYEPRSARYGRDWQGVDKPALPSNYSGILECPCNSRYGGDPVFYPKAGTKQIIHKYTAVPSGTCGTNQGMASAAECFATAQGIGISATSFTNKTVSDTTIPVGCSVVSNKDGSATVYFNTGGTMPCQNATLKVGQAKSDVGVTMRIELEQQGDARSAMQRSQKGIYCQQNDAGVLKSFVAKTNQAPDLSAALQACESFCLSSAECNYCSVREYLDNMEWNAIPSCGKELKWAGALPGDISTKSTASNGKATITLSGPANVWFGVGLDAQTMADSPYTFIVNSSGVTEQKIGTCGSEAEHCPGDTLESSVSLVSNEVVNGVRTVVVTRPFEGKTDKHYTFHPHHVATLNFISAVGSSEVFAYHKAHSASMVTFTSPGVATCICDLGSEGKLCGTNGTSCGAFSKSCLSHAQGGDLGDQKNPTCNSLQYAGGLRCCGHKRIMLDADQEVRPELLQYHMKFRFWFEEYIPSGASVTPKGTTSNSTASHFDLPRIYFQTEANAGEYDIPPAFATKENPRIPGYDNYPVGKLTPGTTCTGTCPGGNDCECVHTITYNHTVSNMRLIYAGGHCHAPACIGIWLYRNDPGHEMELLCHQQPVYGQGHIDESTGGNKYDEAGYVTLPPCLWGDDKGLNPSVLLPPNTELISIKKNRNTKTGHYGEMASWQMRGVNF
jgi:hypothetical protein